MAPLSAAASRRHRKSQKVAIQILDRRPILAPAQCCVAKQLPCPGNFTQPTEPPGIGQRKVQQLERALERVGRQSFVTVAPAAHPPYLAADVGELLEQRQLSPSSCRKLRVPASCFCQRATSLATTTSICRRTAASSIPRDRLPWLGRTLIMESNSMKSGIGKSG